MVLLASKAMRLLVYGLGLPLGSLPAHLAVHTACLACSLVAVAKTCGMPVG